MIETIGKTAVQRKSRAGDEEIALRNYEHDTISYFNAHVLARTGEHFRPLDFVDGHTVLIDRELMKRRRENRQRISGRVGERSMTSRRAA